MSAPYLTDANRGIPSHAGASTGGVDAYAQHTSKLCTYLSIQYQYLYDVTGYFRHNT